MKNFLLRTIAYIYIFGLMLILWIKCGFSLDRALEAQDKIIDNLKTTKLELERRERSRGMYAISFEFLRDNCSWYENYCQHPEGDPEGDGHCTTDIDCPLCKKLVKL